MENSVRNSLQYKLGAIVLGVTIVSLGLFGSALLWHVYESEYEEASSNLQEISRRVRGVLAINHQLMLRDAERHFAVFEAMLKQPIQLEPNVSSGLSVPDFPQLTIGGVPIRPGFALIEQFTRSNIGVGADRELSHF